MTPPKKPLKEALEVPPPTRTRRTHAERGAETQARIKQALVDSITELGFHRTTSAEISRRSGVSWGAAQHHFRDKNGILMAVLVDSFNRLVEELAGQPHEGASLEERVDAFIEGTWRHLRSRHYRSTFEILLNLSMPDWDRSDTPLRNETFDIWDAIWQRFFPEAALETRRRVTLQYYVVGSLSGLAAIRKFEAPSEAQEREQLGFMKDTLLRELGGSRTR